MTYIDYWRKLIPEALKGLSTKVSDVGHVGPTLAAMAVLWPILEDIRHAKRDALVALQEVTQSQAQEVFGLIGLLGDDPVFAANQAAQLSVGSVALRNQILAIANFCNAQEQLRMLVGEQQTTSTSAASFTFSQGVQASLANFGGVTSIENVIIATRTEEQDLMSFLQQAVTSYQLHLYEMRREVPVKPYTFLQPFGMGDQAIFYGREQATANLLTMLLSSRLTVVHAPSGSGKSSLLGAGLGVKLIDLKYLPILVRTYDDPINAIVKQIVQLVPDNPPKLLEKITLRQFLSKVAALCGSHMQEIVILLDQAEDFFTLMTPSQRINTFNALADCIDDLSLPLRVVMAIRKDYFSDLAAFQTRMPSIFFNQFLVSSMTKEELRTAIVGPVQRLDPGFSYDDDVLADLINTLTASTVDLPALQILCTTLHQQTKESGNNQVGKTLYEAMGGARGILSQYLEKASTQFSVLERPYFWSVLFTLINSGGQRLLLWPKDISVAATIAVDDVERILQRVVEARLIRRQEDGRYEIVHDYLADALHVRLSEPEQEVKRAREALIRATNNWRAEHALMQAASLHVIEQFRGVLGVFSQDAARCVLLSAAWLNDMLEPWRDLVDDTTLDQLLALLATPEPSLEQCLARVLGLLGDDRAVEPLRALIIDSTNETVRTEAARALRRLGQRGISVLLTFIRDDATDNVWRAVTEVFVQVPEQQATQAFKQYILESSVGTRIAELGSILMKLCGLTALPVLVDAITNDVNQAEQQVLVDIIYVMVSTSQTGDEVNLRKLQQIRRERIAYLEQQITMYGYNAPVHYITEIENLRVDFLQSEDYLMQQLAERSFLEESFTQIRLLYIIGFEQTRRLLPYLNYARVVEIIVTILQNNQEKSSWHMCASILYELHNEMWQKTAWVWSRRELYSYLELECMQKGRLTEFSILHQSSELNLQIEQEMAKTRDLRTLAANTSLVLAKVIVVALDQDINAETQQQLYKALSVFDSKALEVLVTILTSATYSADKLLVQACVALVNRSTDEIHHWQELKQVIEQSSQAGKQYLERLQIQIELSGTGSLRDVLEADQAATAQRLVEVERHALVISHDLQIAENRLVKLLVTLTKEATTVEAKSAAIQSLGLLGIETDDVIETLAASPINITTLLSIWATKSPKAMNLARHLEYLATTPLLGLQTRFSSSRDYIIDGRKYERLGRIIYQIWVRIDVQMNLIREAEELALSLDSSKTIVAYQNALTVVALAIEHLFIPLQQLWFERPAQALVLRIVDIGFVWQAEETDLRCLAVLRAVKFRVVSALKAAQVRFPNIGLTIPKYTPTSVQVLDVMPEVDVYVFGLDRLHEVCLFLLRERESGIAKLGIWAPVVWQIERHYTRVVLAQIEHDKQLLATLVLQLKSVPMLEISYVQLQPTHIQPQPRIVINSVVANTERFEYSQVNHQWREEVEHQLSRQLRVLSQLLLQQAALSLYTPPATVFDISEKRREIAHLKQSLRDLGVYVADEPENQDIS